MIFIPSLVHLGLLAAVKSPKHLFINCNDKIGAKQGTFNINKNYLLEWKI